MNIAELVKRERPLVRKIIRDETRLCGERRGEPVDQQDEEVLEKVCRIVLKFGADMRKQAESMH